MIRYGCHSDSTGNRPRGGYRRQYVQTGWKYVGGTRQPVMEWVEKEWLPIQCGHIEQTGKGSDPLCAGCANRGF